MSNTTEKLQHILQTEQLDTLLFRGVTPTENRLARVFGGQVLAQCLNAAVRTVPEDRLMHSMHAYFLRPGDVDHPIILEVDPIRDGGSFTTRRVVAKQYGKAIFNTTVSFKIPEQGLEHSDRMPDVPGPEALENDRVRYEDWRKQNPGTTEFLTADAFGCFDLRSVGELPMITEKGHASTNGFWFKPVHPLEADFGMHQAFLAYVSDMRLLMSAMLPHGMRENADRLIRASLDHALWIHHSFDINDWHYYHLNGPVSSGGRGLNFGQFFNREGQLIASSSQEGLMRLRKKD